MRKHIEVRVVLHFQLPDGTELSYEKAEQILSDMIKAGLKEPTLASCTIGGLSSPGVEVSGGNI